MKNEKLLCRSYENTTWGACNPFMMYPYDRQRTRFCALRTPGRQLANQRTDRRGNVLSQESNLYAPYICKARSAGQGQDFITQTSTRLYLTDAYHPNISSAMSSTYAIAIKENPMMAGLPSGSDHRCPDANHPRMTVNTKLSSMATNFRMPNIYVLLA